MENRKIHSLDSTSYCKACESCVGICEFSSKSFLSEDIHNCSGLEGCGKHAKLNSGYREAC